MVEIACLFPLPKFNYLESVSVISVQQWIHIRAGVCLCSDLKSMAAEVLFDSQTSCTGEKASCRFFPSGKREKVSQGEKSIT